MRQCTGCREMKNKKEMMQGLKNSRRMRFFLMPPEERTDAALIYAARQECLEKAVKNRGLERSLKTQIPAGGL